MGKRAMTLSHMEKPFAGGGGRREKTQVMMREGTVNLG